MMSKTDTFLARPQLNGKKYLISKALIDSNISLCRFDIVNGVLKEYKNMKEEIENLKTS